MSRSYGPLAVGSIPGGAQPRGGPLSEVSGAGGARPDHAQGARVEAWVRQEMSLPDSASVSLSEAAGTDPRCSPVVTEVRIEQGGPPFVFHIERALGEVEQMDVVAAMAFGGGH